MKKEKANIPKIIFKALSILLTIICIVTLSIFSYYLFKINIIPSKYILVIYPIILIFILIILIITFRKRNKVLKIIGFLIIGLLSCGFIYINGYLESTYNFLKGMQIKNKEQISFSIITLSESEIDKIEDLKNKKIASLNDEYSSNIKEELNNKISYEEIKTEAFGELPTILEKKQAEAIILENIYYELIKEELPDFEETTKVVYTFSLEIQTHQEEQEKVKIDEEPFILYISGIDQYGKVNSVRGRSDVNQIIVINPKTNHILILNTPRDYYVQLHGTTGLKDKLTHAGIYGIKKSINTLEDLYDININYYLRVNFNSLIKIVDVIDGIDIYSDKAFKSHTISNIYINKGWNHFNGWQALAYSRERYAYASGDNHRGENQQQVITAIINKVTTSKVLISKYNSILSALNGSFQTDVPMDKITSFIKYQLDKMPSWNIESIAVTGYNSSNYTYSMGSKYKLYVMEPNLNSVREAKAKINEVLNES